MKFSRIYSNHPDVFVPIEFNDNLNVVLAEIRLPENKTKDTHNLGKTTLGKLLDFGLLRGNRRSFFLNKHECFQEFVFFFELKLLDGSYLTIRRSVKSASKASFKKHGIRNQDFSKTEHWDHTDLPYRDSKKLLDGLLKLNYLGSFSYRNIVGYLIRSQSDYDGVFMLTKFKGKDRDWKPFLGHLLGYNYTLTKGKYEKEESLKVERNTIKAIRRDLGISEKDIGKLDGLIQLKIIEKKKIDDVVENLDFFNKDKEDITTLVDGIDIQIKIKNSERYSVLKQLKKIETSIESDTIEFDPEKAEKLFGEVGILFRGQIKKDFQQLIDFNVAITEERQRYLKDEYVELNNFLTNLDNSLSELHSERARSLAFLKDYSVFEKYKSVSSKSIELHAELISLENRRDSARRLETHKEKINLLNDEIATAKIEIQKDINKQNSVDDTLFSKIRLNFRDIIHDVLTRQALLNVALNGAGNLDFTAEFLDKSGTATSEDDGHSYKKLLCIAFDFAVLRAHLDDGYPRFVFHDGVFENLDDRKKANLLEVIRSYSALGIQSIITLIDSDLPPNTAGKGSVFEDKEVVLRLHDEGQDGLLFRMESW